VVDNKEKLIVKNINYDFSFFVVKFGGL